MRISDWSSDVCSSDLGVVARKVIDCGHPIGGGRSMTIAVQEEDDGREELDVARQAALFARKAHDVQVQVLELFSADKLGDASSRLFTVEEAAAIARITAANTHKLLSRHHRSEEHTSELQSLMRI